VGLSLTPRELPSLYDRDLLTPLTSTVIEMERRGVPIDREMTRDLQSTFTKKATGTAEELAVWAADVDYANTKNSPKETGREEWEIEGPPNWNSHDQMVLFLHTPLGLDLPRSPYKKKGKVHFDKGEISTDDRALEWLGTNYPEHRAGLNLVRRLRKETRMAGYAASWLQLALPHPDGTWRLHPSFGLAGDRDDRPGAITGRFAVKNPPLQQVPSRGDDAKLLRAAFVAPPGRRLVVADYSQLEVVILAHICFRLFGATGLRDRMRRGVPDIHSTTAKYVWGDVLRYPEAMAASIEDFASGSTKWMRNNTKWIRYGLNYGKGDVGFGSTLFDPQGNPVGVEMAAKLIKALLDFDPEIREYQAYVRRYIREHGAITSLLGRWIPLPDANSSKIGLANRAYRRALNFPMQSGGQEVTAAAMVAVALDDLLRHYGLEIILQVHDELVCTVPEDKAEAATILLSHVMEHALPLDAELQVSAHHAERWSEAK